MAGALCLHSCNDSPEVLTKLLNDIMLKKILK